MGVVESPNAERESRCERDPLSAPLVTLESSSLNSIAILSSMKDRASLKLSNGPIGHGPSEPAHITHGISLDLAVYVRTWPVFAIHRPPFGTPYFTQLDFYCFKGSLHTITSCSTISRCLNTNIHRIASWGSDCAYASDCIWCHMIVRHGTVRSKVATVAPASTSKTSSNELTKFDAIYRSLLLLAAKRR